MSVGQLERAATTPSRWIALSSKDRNNDMLRLPTCLTRRIRTNNLTELMANDLEYSDDEDNKGEDIVDDDDNEDDVDEDEVEFEPALDLFSYLVPGGRYLVASNLDFLSVLDLGCVSDSDISSDDRRASAWTAMVQCTDFYSTDGFSVYPTRDGLGIRILIYS